MSLYFIAIVNVWAAAAAAADTIAIFFFFSIKQLTAIDELYCQVIKHQCCYDDVGVVRLLDLAFGTLKPTRGGYAIEFCYFAVRWYVWLKIRSKAKHVGSFIECYNFFSFCFMKTWAKNKRLSNVILWNVKLHSLNFNIMLRRGTFILWLQLYAFINLHCCNPHVAHWEHLQMS